MSALPSKYTIAVASGKGGVGKSTVAVNLAVALAQAGAKTGLMDADIYGPNVPMMLGLTEARGLTAETRLVPVEKFGIQVISMGFFIDAKEPVVWRGPMLHKAVQMFATQVEWGELEYLIVDLPPGTGDVQLSLSQTLSLAGALIVTTPQAVALADVTKAIKMFEKVRVPILGVVENMSEFECPQCHQVTEIFGRGGGERLAQDYGAPVLGRIGIDARIREGGDRGEPIVVSQPASRPAQVCGEIAARLIERVKAIAPPEPMVVKSGGKSFEV